MMVITERGNFFFPHDPTDPNYIYDGDGWYGYEIGFYSFKDSLFNKKSYEFEALIKVKDNEFENWLRWCVSI